MLQKPFNTVQDKKFNTTIVNSQDMIQFRKSMKAVILAAGDNTRFKREDRRHNKLLHPVLGMPLIERTIRSAKLAGINEFILVTGYKERKIRKLLGNGERLGVNIDYVYNKSWRGENGQSVYAVRGKIDNNFILLMGDHLFEPQVLARLCKKKIRDDESMLAVDYKFREFPNANEATKVQMNKGIILKIGKELTTFNALDTGMFLCSPAIFNTLQNTIKNKKFYLTDAMRILAKEGKLKSFDIKDRFWADIDIHEDLYIAQEPLFKRLTIPKEEGPVSLYINRHFSHRITKSIINTPLTPNQITFISLLLAIISGILLTNPMYISVLMGGILAQLSSIVDGVDGEVARVKLSKSSFGAWFDTILDRYGDFAIILGVGVGLYSKTPSVLIIAVTILALTGSVLTTYSAHTFKTTFGKVGQQKNSNIFFSFPSGRDVRLFIVFIGAVFNLLLPALILIALLTHYKVISRLLYYSMVKLE